jgi:predicted glycoside hydrolase/deacetylase ChbG (UPF0249 family)
MSGRPGRSQLAGTRRLIVNADGFGFGRGATDGIGEAIVEGRFITSVSVNANFPMVDQLGSLLSKAPSISVGVHLNPCAGRPMLPRTEIPSLVNAHGEFYDQHTFRKLLRTGRIRTKDLEREFDAQIGKVRALAGNNLTHLDSQAHTHLGYLSLFVALAKKWNIERVRTNASLICLESKRPILARAFAYARGPQILLGHHYRRYQMRQLRSKGLRTADYLISVGYGGIRKTSINAWRNILRNLPVGTHEIYCHPGHADAVTRRWSYYVNEREQELAVLRNRELQADAHALGVDLISFHAI